MSQTRIGPSDPTPDPAAPRGAWVVWRLRSRRLAPLVSLLLAFLLAGCATSPDKRVLQYLNTYGFGNRYTGDAEEENYVRIGDSFVWQNEFDKSLGGQARIDIDGTVWLPQVGSIHVAGMTRSELEAYLTLQLSRYYTSVDIRIQSMATQGKVYFLFGEVPGAGPRTFTGDLTVFEAILKANPDPFVANLGRVRLVRADPRDPMTITVNVRDIVEGDSTFNVRVQERDILIVPPTMIGRISNFLAAIVTPFTKVLQQVTLSLFQVNRAQNFGSFGGNNSLF